MRTLTINYNENDEGLMTKLALMSRHLPARMCSLEGCSSVDIGIDSISFNPQTGIVDIPPTIISVETGDMDNDCRFHNAFPTACGEVSFQHSWLFTGDNAGNLADNKFQQLVESKHGDQGEALVDALDGGYFQSGDDIYLITWPEMGN